VLQLMKRGGPLRRWYKEIKNRRGSKIARVAQMRRTVTIIWHMLHHNEPYRPYSAPPGAAGKRRGRVAQDAASA
jgi:hypothetical protein